MNIDHNKGVAHLRLDNKSEVYTLNQLAWLGGEVLPPDASITSTPFTSGGEFPKTLSPEDTQASLQGIAELTETSPEEVAQNLETNPEFVQAVHESVRQAFLDRPSSSER